jgi:hypothetical protein
MNCRATINATLPFVLTGFCLFELMIHRQSETFREYAAMVSSLQGALLLCMAVWCGAFLVFSFGWNDWPLIGLVLIAIVAYFMGIGARPATDALTLLFGVTLGRGSGVLLRLKAKGQRLKEDGLQKAEDGDVLEFSLQPSAFSLFLIGLVGLLAFSS